MLVKAPQGTRSQPIGGTEMCTHEPQCPAATAVDAEAAHVVHGHMAEQGWSLLCNGVVVFADGGEIRPDCSILPDHRGPALHRTIQKELAA